MKRRQNVTTALGLVVIQILGTSCSNKQSNSMKSDAGGDVAQTTSVQRDLDNDRLVEKRVSQMPFDQQPISY
jgi:hypothetical protein